MRQAVIKVAERIAQAMLGAEMTRAGTEKKRADGRRSELERNALFVSAILPHRVYPPMFNRYGEGMHFGTHVDGAVRVTPGSSTKLRTDLSASDTIKLAAGDMIVYSSGTRHRVNPVTRGMRVAGVFWIQSLIRDELQRAQLFELDRTIQRLTELNADPESLVRLAGHYHNLLRLWTEL